MSIANPRRTTTMMRQAIMPDARTDTEDGSVLSLIVPLHCHGLFCLHMKQRFC
jgi:hypothetical protein